MKKVAKYVWPRKPEMTRIARSAHNRWNFKTGILVTDLRIYGPRTLPPSLTVRSGTWNPNRLTAGMWYVLGKEMSR